MAALRLDPVPNFYFPTAAFDLVAIATSAGGLLALKQILANLPATFPAALAIVQHLSPRSVSLLPQILNRISPLQVKHAEAGEPLQAGFAYIAPPDRHLLITAEMTIALTRTERINFSRPAADCLFASVAEWLQQRAIAIVLTGKGKDGAEGIRLIKQHGGITIAQEEATAQFPSMPHAAIQTHAIDFVLPLARIAPKVIQLVVRD